jgi:hypothetical protein
MVHHHNIPHGTPTHCSRLSKVSHPEFPHLDMGGPVVFLGYDYIVRIEVLMDDSQPVSGVQSSADLPCDLQDIKGGNVTSTGN